MTAMPPSAYALAMPWSHPAVVQYAHSKLANLLFTLELSRRLAGTGVAPSALHPRSVGGPASSRAVGAV